MDLESKWGAIVNCVADLLGPSVEVVLHDVSRPERSIIMIRNGHVTGRTLGAPLTDLGFYMLRESEHKIETLGTYRSKTDDGKLLQCNAANLRDAHGKIEAILCINIDVSEDGKQVNNQRPITPAEHYQTNIDQVIETMISDARHTVNGSLNRDLKSELVRAMDSRGVFLARGSVRKVASALEIAVPTIYKYIQLARQDRATARTKARSERTPESRPKAPK
jgi:predicted transcriptional regulator YheO